MTLLLRLTVLSMLSSCSPALRARPPDGRPPARLALAVREPRSMVTVDGVALAVHDPDRETGRPAIVCLHAIGHGGGDFEGLHDALGGRYRVISVDWPGHGASAADTRPASAGRYAQLLDGLLSALGLERVILLGNSIGGAAAIREAAAHPHRVRALILANPGGLDPGGFIASLFIGGLIQNFERGVREEAGFAPWFQRYTQGILVTEVARERREKIVAAGYESAPLLVQAWESFRAADAFLAPLIPSVRAPTLFTWARRDGLVQWERSRAAASLFPDARVIFFEAGHAPFLETPAEFLTAVEPFLASLPP